MEISHLWGRDEEERIGKEKPKPKGYPGEDFAMPMDSWVLGQKCSDTSTPSYTIIIGELPRKTLALAWLPLRLCSWRQQLPAPIFVDSLDSAQGFFLVPQRTVLFIWLWSELGYCFRFLSKNYRSKGIIIQGLWAFSTRVFLPNTPFCTCWK